MAKKKFKQINYRLDGIDLVEKSLFKDFITETDTFNFEIKTQSLVDDTKDLVVILVLVNITKIGGTKILGKILIGIGFKVENFKDNIKKNTDGLYVVPDDFERLLKAISISTTRGVMYSELRGTHLHSAILPVIFPDNLKPVKENIFDIVDGKMVFR